MSSSLCERPQSSAWIARRKNDTAQHIPRPLGVNSTDRSLSVGQSVSLGLGAVLDSEVLKSSVRQLVLASGHVLLVLRFNRNP